MQRLIYRLETEEPYLFIDNLDVKSRSRRRRRAQQDQSGDPLLSVRFDLYGYIMPPGSAMTKRGRRAILVCGLCTIAIAMLGLKIYGQLAARPAQGESVVVVADETAEPFELPEIEAYVPPPAAQFSAIVDRPLFNESRRPAVLSDGDGEGDEGPAAESIEATLLGVVVGDKTRVALLLPDDDPEIQRLHLGDSFRGWKVEEIAPRRIVLRSGEDEAVLKLDYATLESYDYEDDEGYDDEEDYEEEEMGEDEESEGISEGG